MSTKEILKKASLRIGSDVKLEGLMRMTGRLKNNSATDSSDVLGFDYLVHHEDSCYEFYAANPPLIGMTEPMPVACPLGIEIFNSYQVDYKEAVKIFQTGNWGDHFVSIVLCKPLVHPQAEEPYWYIRTSLGVQVVIGADSGKVVFPR